MKHSTSEGSFYPFGFREMTLEQTFPEASKLNSSINALKEALRAAERENQDLLIRMKTMRDGHKFELAQLSKENIKLRAAYDVIEQNFNLALSQVKELKQRLKRTERKSSRESVNYAQLRNIREQDKEMQKLREQNKSLRQDSHAQGEAIKNVYGSLKNELEIKFKSAQKSQLLIKLEKDLQESKSTNTSLAKANEQLRVQLSKMQWEMEREKKISEQTKTKSKESGDELDKLKKQHQNLIAKYNDILSFSYEAQKDLEKELYIMARQVLSRRSGNSPYASRRLKRSHETKKSRSSSRPDSP